MQTARLLKAIQKLGTSFIILLMGFSQFAGVVSHARADSTTPPVITQGASITMNVDENSFTNRLTLDSTGAAGATLTWSISTPATNGTATLADPATGSLMVIGYTPGTDYSGSDFFTVQVNDGNGGMAGITS